MIRAIGAGPGDTVSVVMPNGVNTLRVLDGALYGGRCVNPVNLLAQPEQKRCERHQNRHHQEALIFGA
jgi:hypothetical protein